MGGKHTKAGWLNLVDVLNLTYFLTPALIPENIKDQNLFET
jgi:hypothetical protein